jgi:alpha-1,3/alpha-1,6-mannosyltransferase
VFYCHFPDQLLTQRKSLLKKLYRLPLDYLEEITTAQADQILVNSLFTATVFKNTFRRISTVPAVLYPAVDDRNFPESDSQQRL